MSSSDRLDRSRRPLGSLGTATLGLLMAAMSAHAGKPCPRYQPQCYTWQARGAVRSSLGAQAAAGEVRGDTLWNYHFDEMDGELNDAGRAALDRFIRRHGRCLNTLYLQTAWDLAEVPLTDKEKKDGRVKTTSEVYAEKLDSRTELNAARMASVEEYLQKFHGVGAVAIAFHDLDRFDIAGPEAVRAVRFVGSSAEGSLPESLGYASFSFEGSTAPAPPADGSQKLPEYEAEQTTGFLVRPDSPVGVPGMN
jgi:hypothetical protein